MQPTSNGEASTLNGTAWRAHASPEGWLKVGVQSGLLSSLQGLQNCCREIFSCNCAWKLPWKPDRNSNTPVALRFLWYRRLSLLHPHSVRKSGLLQSKDKPNKGVSQKKLASEAYRAIGGVARNSIANRAIVGHLGKLPWKPP